MVHYMYIIFLFLQIAEIKSQRTKHPIHLTFKKGKNAPDFSWETDLKWSSYSKSKSVEDGAGKESSDGETLESPSRSKTDTSSTSSMSSEDTREFKKRRRFYRTCKPCPVEMLMTYKNKAIRWICAGYQRARRSFKSECMMRFRNCQDGTISVSYSVTNVTSTTTNGTTTLLTTKNGNLTIAEVVNSMNTRRKSKARSTSSDSDDSEGDKKSKEKGQKEELDLSSDDSSSSSDTGKKKKAKPKTSKERKGWRRWHRKCTPCPEFELKWKTPSISWICGAYQRARRSFKSYCMMHFRNCQDGTMFTQIYNGRCKDDAYHGIHFFYDYKVELSDEGSSSKSSTSESKTDSMEDSFPQFDNSEQRELNRFVAGSER